MRLVAHYSGRSIEDDVPPDLTGDRLFRRLSARFYVLLHGRFAPPSRLLHRGEPLASDAVASEVLDEGDEVHLV